MPARARWSPSERGADAAPSRFGQVAAPDGFQLHPYPVLDRDHVWAVVKGADDVPFVVRFRIERE